MLANYVAVQYSNERMEVDGKGYFTGRATTTRAGLSNLFCLFLFIFFLIFLFIFHFISATSTTAGRSSSSKK